MAFTRFNAERGGMVPLQATFKKDGALADPYNYNQITVDILNTDGSFVTGPFFGSETDIELSGLIPARDSVGVFTYNFQTLSGMDIGTYQDRWNNIQFSAGSDVISGVFSFSILYNTEDQSDWDVIPG